MKSGLIPITMMEMEMEERVFCKNLNMATQ